MKTNITVITNNKGGVGKSTTADALADGLVLRAHKITERIQNSHAR